MNMNDLFAAVTKLDLNPIKEKLMHVPSGEGWSAAKADAVEKEYRRFLCLMRMYPNEMIAPLVDVDTFWHYHILDTMKYARDCEQAFGYFLHHYPYVGMRGEDDAQVRVDSAERMRTLYEATFGDSFTQRAAELAQIGAVRTVPVPGKAPQSATAYCASPRPAPEATAYCASPRPAPAATAFCAGPVRTVSATAFCAGPVPTVSATAFCAGPVPTAPETAFCAGPVPTVSATAFCAGPVPTVPETAFCAGPVPTVSATAFCAGPVPTAPETAFCAGPVPTVSATAFCAGPVPTVSATAFCAGPVPTKPNAAGRAGARVAAPAMH